MAGSCCRGMQSELRLRLMGEGPFSVELVCLAFAASTVAPGGSICSYVRIVDLKTAF